MARDGVELDAGRDAAAHDGPPVDHPATGEAGLPVDRLRVTVSLQNACETLAGITVTVMPGDATDYVALAASVWTTPVPLARPDCYPPGPSPTVDWIVAIPGRSQNNPGVGVRDGNFPSGWAGFGYDRSACPRPVDWSCYGTAPAGTAAAGEPCTTDCSCQGDLACVGFPAGVTGAPTWQCLRPCTSANDCAGGEGCGSQVEGPAMVCGPGPAGCASDPDCPPGFRCDPLHERCYDPAWATVGAPCACDSECASGQHCAVARDGVARCTVWCQDVNDCPPDTGLYWFVCGSDGTCWPQDG